MATYLLFNSEKAATEAEMQICEKMNLPTEITFCFAEVRKAHEQNFWFFITPEPRYLVGLEIEYKFIEDIEPFLPPKGEQEKELLKELEEIKQQTNEH